MFDPETPPELAVSRWFNTREPLELAGLKGRVVVVLAFQMLCPGCVDHALPQAQRLQARFNPDQVVIIGLHSVFENHDAMTASDLEAFIAESELTLPIAIDVPNGDEPPHTMANYQMQGTPTLLMFDRVGRLRRHYFGQPDDILLAAEIMALAIEDKGGSRDEAALIERKLAAILAADRQGEHDHEHGDACGCDHHHDHGHDHGHHHQSEPLAEAGAADRLQEAERRTEPPRNARPGRDAG